jgi:8-oxo-dGTP pyrophosphatase MutT (NUDIX family)
MPHTYGDSAVPDWLRPIVEVCATVQAGDLSRFSAPPGSAPRRASVLILFGSGAEGHTVLLLERAHDMRSHAGQVAFPGGAQDDGDIDEVAAALREAHEETGLDPAGVTVIGVLPALWLPPSNFAVTPVVGWWQAPSAVYAVDAAETASVHAVPLAELLDPANRVSVQHPSGFVGPAFLVRDLVVWGFTAGLLSRLLALAGWELPWDEEAVLELPPDLVASSLADVEASAER